MKNLLFLASLFIYCCPVNAQNIINGNFQAPNNGNDFPYYCLGFPSSVTFSDTSIPNWQRSHGGPMIRPANPPGSNPTCPSGLQISDAYLAAYGHASSGILGNYNFSAGITYQVEIDICRSVIEEGNIFLYAANNLQRNLVIDNTFGCGSQIPSNTNNTLLIGSVGNIPGIFVGDGTYSFTVTIPTGSSYNGLWIFMKTNENYTTNNWNAAMITAVRILSVCKSLRVFSAGTIPAGLHRYENILGGSSYGLFSTPVKNNINSETILRAGETIILKDNFIAGAADNNFFVAEIVPCDIVQSPKPAPLSSETSQLVEQKRLTVFPNPASQNITIKYVARDSGKVTFTITDMAGKILNSLVKDQLSTEAQETSFNISSLSPGNYILHAQCNGYRETSKFTVIP